MNFFRKAPPPFLARQGDIMLERVSAVPRDAAVTDRDEHGRLVLARGEAHDHTHAIRDKNVCGYSVLDPREVDYFIVSGGGANLTHEFSSGDQADHLPLSLEPGTYRVLRQREYVAPKVVRRAFD